MNVIDHAILIPASPAFIWRFLGDISRNPQWQEDCTNISFLTTQREGRGTRWRYANKKGKDVVIEITAWYDTLGYEYIIVDGGSVGENKGRIRLQEIAEGTLVQWTFNYEVEGVLSGLRNSIGLKRSLTNDIQDSLRNLYKLVQNETGGIPTHEAKALLKEAPDVDERSSYQPRHPSTFQEAEDLVSEPEYPSEQPIHYDIENEPIPEPPVADDDTKPNPIVQGTEEIPVVSDVSEPDFLQTVTEPPLAEGDTKPHDVIIEPEPEASPVVSQQDSPEATTEEPEQIEAAEQVPENRSSEELITPSPDMRDTSSVSVFEVFGLQKPSETEEMRAITDSDLAESDTAPDLPSSSSVTEIETNESTAPRDVEVSPSESPPSLVQESQEFDDTADVLEMQSTAKDTVEHVHLEVDDDESVTSSFIESSTGLRLRLRRKIVELRARR